MCGAHSVSSLMEDSSRVLRYLVFSPRSNRGTKWLRFGFELSRKVSSREELRAAMKTSTTSAAKSKLFYDRINEGATAIGEQRLTFCSQRVLSLVSFVRNPLMASRSLSFIRQPRRSISVISDREVGRARRYSKTFVQPLSGSQNRSMSNFRTTLWLEISLMSSSAPI